MPLVADANGRISSSFQIPANLTAGTKRVDAVGRGGTRAGASYTGSGTIEVRTLQRVFTVRRWREVEPPITVMDPNNTGPNGGEGGGSTDPLAQTFTLNESRHITSAEVKFCAIGNRANGSICQIREVSLGVPTQRVVAEAFLNMTSVQIGQWSKFAFRAPVFLRAGVEYALVFMTDDGYHALHTAELGAFDAAKQQWITGNAYIRGVLLSSSNQSTWTPHNAHDLTFKLNVARFTATERIIDAGDFQLTNVTDLVIFAGIEVPIEGTSVMIILTRANGAQVLLQPGQPLRLDERITEMINIKFRLRGNALHSPTLFPFMQLFKGNQLDDANYVSRASLAGANTRALVTFECLLPGTSTVEVKVGKRQVGAPAMVPLPTFNSVPVGDGWMERTYEVTGYNLDELRAELILHGTPQFRPFVRDLRVITTNPPTNITA